MLSNGVETDDNDASSTASALSDLDKNTEVAYLRSEKRGEDRNPLGVLSSEWVSLGAEALSGHRCGTRVRPTENPLRATT